MGSKDQVREHGEPCHDVRIDHLIGAVIVDIGIFSLIHVQRDAVEFIGFQAPDQRLRIHERSAGRVDQHDFVFHDADRLVVDQVVGPVRPHDERRMERDQVRLPEQLFLGDVFEKPLLFQALVGERVPAEHGHSIALADICHDLADPACSHDACHFIVQVKAQKTAESEVVVLDLDVGLVDAAVGRLQDRHGMLCHCIGRVRRDAQHRDPVLRGSLGINIVETGTAQKDQPDTALAQDLNDFARRLVIDKNTHSVKALGKGSGFDRQTAVEVFDVDVICALSFVF